MNWIKANLLAFVSLVILIGLATCSPSLADIDTTHAQAATAAIFATQTAKAPTVTQTPPSTSTPTKTPTVTSTLSVKELAQEYYLRGVEHQNESEWHLAIDEYSEAISIDPDFAEAYINRGLSYYLSHDTEAAVADFVTAFELDYEPQTPQMYVNRGRANSVWEDYDQAIQDFTKAIDLDPNFSEAYVRRGNIFAWNLKDYENAFPDFEAAISIDPEYALAYQKRGFAYVHRGEHDLAIKDLDLAIDLDPQSAYNYYYRGLAYYDLKEYEKAVQDFDQASELDPADPWPYCQRALSYRFSGNDDLAVTELKRAVELDPQNSYFVFIRGILYSDLGEIENAVGDLEKAVALGLGSEEEEYALNLIDELAHGQADNILPHPDWLVTVDELTALTDKFEIINWEVIDQVVWDFRVCSVFSGHSSSASPNLSINCIYKLAPGMSLDETIDTLYGESILSSNAMKIDPQTGYEGEYALFAEMDENGHSFYTAILIKDGLLYLVGLSLGTGLGYLPITLYDDVGELIDAYLINVLEINEEKRNSDSAQIGTDKAVRVFGGETSQGKEFIFTVENHMITSIQVGFDISGCESWSPFAQLYVKYPIDENTISIIDTNLEITGNFDSPDSASGIMSIHPAICDGEVDVTWSVSTEYVPPPPDIPEGSLPEMEIPEGLFNPKAGDKNFYHPGIASQGDWFLYTSALESILPIPAGWSTNETGKETNIMFFEKGRPDEPTIFIRLATIPESDGGTDPSTATINDISDNLKALGVHKILAVETLDDDKGYILANLHYESDTSEMMLLFTSLSLNNPSGSLTHLFAVYTATDEWKEYYPIIRAMLEKWFALDYTPLGEQLPESLNE